MNDIGSVDVLLIPVGGVFTIDAEEASRVCNEIKPKIAIPMHYKTDRCGFLKWSADDFIKGKKNARKLETSEIEIRKNSLPAVTEFLVPRYAL
jgi:L-ascorbate metabolism protein UlaG (beta-lactamase superfamily)